MKVFEYCPDCKHEGVTTIKSIPKIIRYGTDGWGQPVRFTECECGGKQKGFLSLDFYRAKEAEDKSFLNYLKHRIAFYIVTGN